MPIHDWTRVHAGIFHDFHHGWVEEIKRALNGGLLPEPYYALAEQQAAGYGPDVLTLQSHDPTSDAWKADTGGNGPTTATLAPPRARIMVQSDMEYYRRKKSSVVIRHVSDDRIVAVVEIVSPGNKASQNAIRALIHKTCDLLEKKIHLLIIDVFPPTKRDPLGIHAAIWQDLAGEEDFIPPADKPLTLAAYESDLVIKAYVEPVAVGDVLPEMPVILEPGGAVHLPLEPTYNAAWAGVPRRWQTVLESASS